MDSFHEVNKAHDMIKTSFTQFFGVEYPVIQGGMVWCSGWRLASAVSEAGGLGIIGSGSMYPDILREHIQKIRLATQKPFGVNVPLMYAHADQLIDVMIEEKIPVVITSAGSPSKYTSRFHEAGIKVIHVVSNLKFALKSQEAGVDAIVFEGFEAGGHNGNEETSTLVLMQLLRKHITIPLLAAGGIGSGEAILGLLAMGADGVQIGSLFAAAFESSAHDSFKSLIVEAGDGSTDLVLKKIGATRLLKNKFYTQVKELEYKGGSAEELKLLLGKGRARMGMFEGDIDEGELEIGQIAGCIDKVKTVNEIFEELKHSFQMALNRMKCFE